MAPEIVRFTSSFTLLLVMINKVISEGAESSCPDVLTMWVDPGEQDCHGYVQLNNFRESDVETIVINFCYDHILTRGYRGTFKLYQSSQPVTYYIHFPVRKVLPFVQNITVNGDIICNGQPETKYGTRVALTLRYPRRFKVIEPKNQASYVAMRQPHNQLFHETTTTTTTTPAPSTVTTPSTSTQTVNPEYANDDNCGKVSPDALLTSLAINGKTVFKGQFPWIAPVFVRDESRKPVYTCGSTIISERFLITAAHCTYEGSMLLSPKRLMAVPGMHNINDLADEDAQISFIDKIIPHQDYRESNKLNDADIAMLRLKRSLDFTDYIVPICLGPSEKDISRVVNRVGFVAGWGITENGTTSFPTSAQSLVTDLEDCGENLDRDFYPYMRLFCGDGIQGATPCNGDSGSGLVIKYGKRHQLRGVLSKGLVDPNTLKCDTTKHVVYTDVARFRDWIKEVANV